MMSKTSETRLDRSVEERNELSVLEALVRVLRLTSAKAAPHAAIWKHCRAGLPPPVVDEVLNRLIAQGHVDREARAEAAVRTADSAPEHMRDGIEEIRYFITEVGFERYNTAANVAASAKLAELRERLITFGLTERHLKMWASLYDYLMWKPGRTVHFMNYGLGFKLTTEEIWLYREILFDFGLIERGALESHIMLTEIGARYPRISSVAISTT